MKTKNRCLIKGYNRIFIIRAQLPIKHTAFVLIMRVIKWVKLKHKSAYTYPHLSHTLWINKVLKITSEIIQWYYISK